METTASRNTEQAQNQEKEWPREVQPGRAIVRVYKRKTPKGNFSYMVANYADDNKRRFDCYGTEEEALQAADTLARRLDKRDYVAAAMTKEQAIEYANSSQVLQQYNVTVSAAANVVAECLKTVPDLATIQAAVRIYALKHKKTIKKPISEVITEMLAIKKLRTKKGRAASERYLTDLENRLDRFAKDCNKDCCNITTEDIQAWLDGLKLSPQSYKNFRTVLHTLFKFAVTKSYTAENPVDGVEGIDSTNGKDIVIFKPDEIARLLAAAQEHYPDYLPCLAIGAFAGLRSAEIQRLEWSDIDLNDRIIRLGASKTKTASRRIVPISGNLAAWLEDYAQCTGKIWKDSAILFHKRQEAVAAATAVEADSEKNIAARKPVAWKQNALRHSYCSYRFALINDAGRVAAELGNSADTVYRHYRELVKPEAAKTWFSVMPEEPANVVPLATAAAAV